MSNKRQSGFSLLELLLVCTVIGILATLAIPYLRKAVHATENRSTRTTLRSVATTQLSFSTGSGRYGRLSEINNIMGGVIGTLGGSEITRGQFTISMVPAAPTDAELRSGYTITATRTIPGDGIYIYELNESGKVEQISPFCAPGEECN